MSATTKKVLVMDFSAAAANRTRSVRITDPKEDLTAAQVEEAMQKLVDLNAFVSFVSEGPVSLKGARTVQTVTNKFDISVD